MVVKNLEFFDKNGYNLNLNWNEVYQIWEGNIFFPRVSVGLYENTTIYIMEDLKYGSNDDRYSYPTGEGNIVFQWDIVNSFVDEFFMFNFDDDYVLKDTSSLIYTPYDGPLCETLIINRFDKYNVPLKEDIEQNDLLEVHVAFIASENSSECTYKRTLVISYENGYTKYDIAKITFYAETIEEDERLKVWNENLGYNLKPEDTILFKHSDIHEYMPNYELLNEKRKELMLEGHNIYPFIGSYKAILNAIKFFGYDNLNIVEYWRNINGYDSEFGKIYRTYVYSLKNKKSYSTKRKPISLDTQNFQKLNHISLVYNINHPEKVDGIKYDDYGLPNVIEDFDKDKRDDFRLTIEEALVKLFALKKKLNDEFMPGSTKITDIIGEGNYFGINLIGNNPQISTVNYVELRERVNFKVFPDKHVYLTENEGFARFIAEQRDLHIDETIGELGNKTIEELGKEYGDSDSDSDIAINELDKRTLGHIINGLMEKENNVVCNLYDEYYTLTDGNKFGDAKDYGLIDIPEPRIIYKDIVLDDVPNDPYGENEIIPDMVVCAKAILTGEYNDDIDITSPIEWKVTHPETGWSVTYSGDVNIYGSVFVQLPYLGNYDVEIRVWDRYNHCCYQFEKDAIIVEPYNIEIRGFYLDARPLPDNLKYDLMVPQEYLENVENKYKYYLWLRNKSSEIDGVSDSNENYSKIGIITYKRNPMEITFSDIFTEYEIQDGKIGDYDKWENIGSVERSFRICVVNSESDGENVLKFAYMKDEDKNGNVSYGVEEFEFACELTDFNLDIKNIYDPETNKDALYHVIKKNVDKMYSGALQEHLYNEGNTSMRNYQPDGTVSFKGPYYKFDVDTILYRIDRGYKEYDHLNAEIINLEPGEHYKYVRYINSVVDVKPLTWIVLGFDYSSITGKIINDDYPKWTLTFIGNELDPDEDYQKDKVITTHNGLYFTYLLEDEGVYKIKLELIDINGNKYEFEKPIVIVDKNANYEMYHTLKDEYDKYLEEKNERNLIKLN